MIGNFVINSLTQYIEGMPGLEHYLDLMLGFMFCLFILSVLFWFVYLLLYVLCSLNQGIAAKE